MTIDLAALRAQASDPDFSRTSGIVVPAHTVLALLDRLAAAEKLIDNLRHRGALVNNEFIGTADAWAAYDRAIAGQQQRQVGTT